MWRTVFSSEKGMRSGWKILLFFGLLSLLGLPLQVWHSFELHVQIADAGKKLEINLQYPFNLPTLLLLVIVLSLVMVLFVDKRPWQSLGLTFYTGWLKEFGIGVALGSLGGLFFLALNFLIVTFAYRLDFEPLHLSISMAVQFLAWNALIFALVVLFEEALFRGYPFQALIQMMGVIPAVLSTSVVFGIYHLIGGSWQRVPNAALLGIVLASAAWKSRGLWMPLGIHFAWNETVTLEAFTNPPLAEGHPFISLSSIFIACGLLLVIIIGGITAHPQAKALWDRYVQPAPFPPWRREEA